MRNDLGEVVDPNRAMSVFYFPDDKNDQNTCYKF